MKCFFLKDLSETIDVDFIFKVMIPDVLLSYKHRKIAVILNTVKYCNGQTNLVLITFKKRDASLQCGFLIFFVEQNQILQNSKEPKTRQSN